MKAYAKVLLYAYPFLKTVGKDYEEHIQNKAVLSYDSKWSAERLAEYLAGEVLQMRRLEWLKGKLDGVINGLSGVEKTLLAIRYFGKRKWRKKLVQEKGAHAPLQKRWTERTYFRRQQRLGEKITGLFAQAGLSEKLYEDTFAAMELFAKIQARIETKERESAGAGVR